MFLCRYLTIDKLLDLLINKRVYFSSINNFSDKQELYSSLLTRSESIRSFDDLHKGVHENNQNKQQDNKKNMFLLCCRNENPNVLAKSEFLLMWDMYTNKSDLAVKVAFNKEKLITYFESIFKIGNIDFCHKNVLYNNSDLKSEERLFRKDINYSFEQEYRFILETGDSSENLFAPYCCRKFPETPLNIKSFKWVEEKHSELFQNLNDQQCQHIVNMQQESEKGYYVPLDYIKNSDLIDHVQFSPYCSQLTKRNLGYLIKTLLFPQLSYTFLEGCGSEETIYKHSKIKTSSFDNTVNNYLVNAVSPYDYISDKEK